MSDDADERIAALVHAPDETELAGAPANSVDEILTPQQVAAAVTVEPIKPELLFSGERAIDADAVVGTFEPFKEKVDNGEILGALSSALKNSPSFEAAVARRIAQQAPITQRVPMQKARQYAISFRPVEIPAGTTVTIQERCECLFRGEQIIFDGDPEDARWFRVMLLIGSRSQMSLGPVPMTVITNALALREGRLDTCERGLTISWTVTNCASTAKTWAASIIGRAVL